MEVGAALAPEAVEATCDPAEVWTKIPPDNVDAKTPVFPVVVLAATALVRIDEAAAKIITVLEAAAFVAFGNPVSVTVIVDCKVVVEML